MERPFEVIPAIDIMGGRLARLRKGDPATLRVFSGSPFEAAEAFVGQGARWLHVVDLDAAFGSGPANVDLLSRIAELPVKVQAGGGLSPEAAFRALDAGADRAVIGSASLQDRDAVEGAIETLGERVAVALEVRGERIVPRGSGIPGPPLEPTVRWLGERGCPRFVYTNVDRDGALSGPDLPGVCRVLEMADVPVIASGGVASLDDLRSLRDLGAEGAVVGHALAEAGLDLAEALRLS